MKSYAEFCEPLIILSGFPHKFHVSSQFSGLLYIIFSVFCGDSSFSSFLTFSWSTQSFPPLFFFSCCSCFQLFCAFSAAFAIASLTAESFGSPSQGAGGVLKRSLPRFFSFRRPKRPFLPSSVSTSVLPFSARNFQVAVFLLIFEIFENYAYNCCTLSKIELWNYESPHEILLYFPPFPSIREFSNIPNLHSFVRSAVNLLPVLSKTKTGRRSSFANWICPKFCS